MLSPGSAPPPSAAEAGAPEERAHVVVRRILQADDFPAFSRVMSELMTSLHDEKASAQRLANLVLRDYALTVKVIRTANTVHYNRSGRPVQSATHALMLLGASTVRDLASTLLLFEHYRRRSPGLKELMLLSLLTASHARSAAERSGGVDPETAQLCGMFRNLGEVLVAAHLPDEYARLLRETRERGAALRGREVAVARAHAAIAVLGCSFEDIGVAIARHWGMPDAVRAGMRAVGAAGEERAASCTAFAHDLATVIYREEPGAARDGVTRVLATHGRRLALSRDALAAIADEAVVETRETFAAARVALDDLRLARQITAALAPPVAIVAALEDPEEAPVDENEGSPDAPPPAGDASAERGPAGGDDRLSAAPRAGAALAALRDRLGAELAGAADDVAGYDVERVLLLALEGALRGGPFDRACFCPADVRAGEFRARFGLGAGSELLVERLRVSYGPGVAGPGPALLRGEEVYLAHGTRLSLHDAQLLRMVGSSSAAFLPLILDGSAIGALFVDRRGPAAALDATTLVYLRQLGQAAAHAMTARRSPAPALPPRTPPPAEQAELVLRLLRGESIDRVAAEAGVAVPALDGWRREFLAGALARLGAG